MIFGKPRWDKSKKPIHEMNREDILQEMSDAIPKAYSRAELEYAKNLANDPNPIRIFSTGATRDIDTDKHDPEGFLSPLVINRFNEFMHKNRIQKDGSYRDSDNWQHGIPLSAYIKSGQRHNQDWWLHHRGYGDLAREDLETALCAIIFNASGYLFEILKGKK